MRVEVLVPNAHTKLVHAFRVAAVRVRPVRSCPGVGVRDRDLFTRTTSHRR